MITLAIDCGTTSTRVLAFDGDFNIVASAQKAIPSHYPEAQWVEQDPMELWQLTKQCLDNVIGSVGPESIDCMGITNQRETSIVWQKSTGTPLGPAINWQCRRTYKRCIALTEHKDTIKFKTGLPLDPYFSATKFEWLIQQSSQALSLMQQNDLCLGTVDTWLLYNLTKGTVFATDVTNASRTMLFDIHKKAFDQRLCDIFSIPIHALPTVNDSIGCFGTYENNHHLIPIHAMIGDQQSSLFAQCGRVPGQIKNTYGTGLFLMANTGRAPVASPDLISTIAIAHNGHVDYAIEGSCFTGGSLIQWLRDSLGLIDTAEETSTLAESVLSNGGVTIIPALTGLGAPYWNPGATGMICGLTKHTKKAHIVRAALEAIALQSNDIIAIIKQHCPIISFNTLCVDGGGSSNHWLMQLQADVSGLTVAPSPCLEATALGAAMCARLHTTSVSLPVSYNPKGITFQPKTSRVALIEQWQQHMGPFNTR